MTNYKIVLKSLNYKIKDYETLKEFIAVYLYILNSPFTKADERDEENDEKNEQPLIDGIFINLKSIRNLLFISSWLMAISDIFEKF